MTTGLPKRPPGENEIGARIRVFAPRAAEAAEIFAKLEFRPIYRDERDDGTVSFWFGKLDDADLFRLCNSLPGEFYALRGTVR